MKQKPIIVLIILGAIILYCAKVFIQASIAAPCDRLDAYYSLLGWTMYLVGWASFIGGLVAQAIKIVMQVTDNLK